MSSFGPLNVCTITGDTKAILNILLNPAHNQAYLNVNAQEGNSTLQFSVVDCTIINIDLHICGIATNKAIYHTKTTSTDVGNNHYVVQWQSTYGDVNSVNSGSGYAFEDLSCAGNASNGDVHVCAVGTSGTLLHTIRNAQGNWQGFYGDVNSENKGGSDHPAPFTHVDSTIINGTLHVCAIDTNGAVWYTYRTPDPNASWQGSFLRLTDFLQGPASDISCTSIDNVLHVCAVNSLTGFITHTSLPDGGSWQSADVAPSYDRQTSGARFFTLDCGIVQGYNDLHVCATNTYGHILHTVRDSSGNWQGTYDDVNQAQGLSGSYTVVSVCSGG